MPRMCENSVRRKKETAILCIFISGVYVTRVELFISLSDAEILPGYLETQAPVNPIHLIPIVAENKSITQGSPPQLAALPLHLNLCIQTIAGPDTWVFPAVTMPFPDMVLKSAHETFQNRDGNLARGRSR